MSQFSMPMSIKDIAKVLPHRYPFLLIDRIIRCDLEKGEVEAIKNLTINEAFFQGHFPGAPIMPGVLILEALAQAGGVLVYQRANPDVPKIAVLLNINGAKFRSPAKPGDQLRLVCKGLHFSGKGGKVQATAYVEDKIAVEAEIGFALVEEKLI
ncbi:3-hydroxyacyl-ACP dehydratase FabZ [Estrella lausannensis]|uniref:3-hydroxyacyl-[acyl-carrier-protein] dehydratase FabZ n=1 Tax=Estrella lausannensis TaxID=483423 RepID=A0A0H5DNF2_9BACT|nr:3-hydroxyacyl-ACP dehydratase FabZ [Estrella lausannensis]CRX37841.1 (3R)-hydroxymyristoyl-[acyl-carrier-protein]dehydratase [Estrella lausannensis]